MNWGISIRRSHKLHHTLNGENPMSMPIWLLSLLPCTTYTGALVRGHERQGQGWPGARGQCVPLHHLQGPVRSCETADALPRTQEGPETTVRQLADLVEDGSKNPPMMSFPSWGMQWWCRMTRGILQRSLMFPLTALPYGLKVKGRENLEGITGPVLFASNHNLGLDNPLIIKAVPLKWRRRMAVAGAADLWKNPVWWIMNPIMGNGFPLAKQGAVRPSLENMGKIMDNGWSVLIYPEGELTVGGPIKPFMNGTGLVAVEGRIPVVPLRLHIHTLGSPIRFPLLKRGSIEVKFGAPLSFPPGTDYQDATAAIENAVKAL